MPRETRAATGNSRPRLFEAPPTPVAPRKRAAPRPKANTTAKRAPKKAAAGSKPVGVKKTSAKTGGAGAAVKAKAEKVKAVVEKKVSWWRFSMFNVWFSLSSTRLHVL